MSENKVREIAQMTGVSEREVERVIKQLTYRKLYNKRPEVVERRKQYNKERQATMKEAMKLYRQHQHEENQRFAEQLERDREQSATEQGATGIHGSE